MSESLDFALKPGVQRGDSAFLLNQGRHRLAFDPFPGRMIALAFLSSIADPAAQSALTALSAKRRLVDEGKAAFFAVVPESESEAESGLKLRFPSIVFLSDGDETARAFGVERCLIILDPMLRVIDVAPLDEMDRALAHLGDQPQPSGALEPSLPAPILVLPHVFEPELCAHLIACFERGGGAESGFMQDQGGRGIENFDGELEAPARFPSDRPAPHRQLESARRAKDLSGDQEGVSDALNPDRARPRCAL